MLMQAAFATGLMHAKSSLKLEVALRRRIEHGAPIVVTQILIPLTEEC